MEEQTPQTIEVKPTKQKNPFKIATIVLTVVVLLLGGGLAYALISSNNDNSSNKQENINDDSELNEIKKPENEEVSDLPENNNLSPESNVTFNTAPYITDNYFFIPEWGVKYKLSDELVEWGYSVLPNSISATWGHVIGLTAFFKKDLVEEPQARYYDTINTCSIVTISRTTKNLTPNPDNYPIYIRFNEYTYIIYDYRSHDSCTFNSKDTNERIANKLTEILLKPENI
jgi:flagellar basal body-associated protein FliL